MSFLNSLRGIIRARAPSRVSQRRLERGRLSRRLLLEPLEDRMLPSTVSLVPSEAAPQLVGARITWTATATDCGTAPVYQFRVAPHAGASRVVRDYSPTNTFAWTPMQEGTYDIQVTVKDGYQGTETCSAVAADAVASRVTGSQAVITPTLNPLVALYSVPPSAARTVFVQFSAAGDQPSWRSTDTRPIVPGKSTNVFVAGMLPATSYQMRYVLSNGTASPPQIFTTGTLPSTLTFPPFTVTQPPGPGSDLDQDMIFHVLAGRALKGNLIPHPIVTDLQGQVEWYYDTQKSGLGITNLTPATLLPGGTVIGMGNDRYSVRNNRDVLREIDLAGNPLRETNLAVVNAQLTAMGHEVIYGFHHEAQRLPNGAIAVLGLTERSININGVPTNYIGELTILLNEDLQVAWAWDAFDHLDVNRGPVLGEVVFPGSTEPTAVVPNLPAVDWLHVNAVAWSPADGNLILSVRHQDWVIKIDYRNGAGDGHVVWRLGEGGDFTVHADDPSPWFSHQHNAHYLDNKTLILFDNGNTRREEGDPNAHSRGQVWKINEKNMKAHLVFNGDLGVYSDRVGAAQRLSNGNYFFTAGSLGQAPNRFGQEIEVRPDGTQAYAMESDRVDRLVYRSYRMRTLYGGVSDRVVDEDEESDSANEFKSSVAAALTSSAKASVNPMVPWCSAATEGGMALPFGTGESAFFTAGMEKARWPAVARAKQNAQGRSGDLWAAVFGRDGALQPSIDDFWSGS